MQLQDAEFMIFFSCWIRYPGMSAWEIQRRQDQSDHAAAEKRFDELHEE